MVFRGMATQWRLLVGMGGAVYQGLRYECLPLVMAANKAVPHRQPLDELMAQIACLERAALDVLNA